MCICLRYDSLKVTCPHCKRHIRIRRGETITCNCGYSLSYRRFFNEKINHVVYLIDTNILIYASHKNNPRVRYCRQVVSFDSPDIKMGITERIRRELGDLADNLPKNIIVYKTGPILDDLLDLKTNYLKQPSETDLSLIQAARQHPEVRGIITYDKDFGRIAASGIIERNSSVKFWLGDAKKFLEKYEIKRKVGKKYDLCDLWC